MSGVKGVWSKVRLVSKVSAVNVSCVKDVWCKRCLEENAFGVKGVWCKRVLRKRCLV